MKVDIAIRNGKVVDPAAHREGFGDIFIQNGKIVDGGADVGHGLQADLAAGHGMAAFLEDQHHVECRAAAGPGEEHFHRTRRQILAARFRGAIHQDSVIAAGFCQEGHASRNPFDVAFHALLSSFGSMAGVTEV